MGKLWTISVGLVALLLLLALPFPANAQESEEFEADPEFVILDIADFLNEGDVNSALGLVADNAVFTFFSPPNATGVYVGKGEVQTRWNEFIERHGEIILEDIQVHGATVSWTATVYDESYDNLELDSLEFIGMGMVQGGLLQSYTWSMTDDSLRQFTEAVNKATVLRYTDALMTGNATVFDEILADDFVDYHALDVSEGREGAKQWLEILHSAFSNIDITVYDIVASGDTVVLQATFSGDHTGEFLGLPASGNSYSVPTIAVAHLEEGKIIDWSEEGNILSLVQADSWIQEIDFLLADLEFCEAQAMLAELPYGSYLPLTGR